MLAELAEESEKIFWIIDFDNINKETQEAMKNNKTAFGKTILQVSRASEKQ
ncbi:MAG: hypothetical protein LBG92_11710 [Prevotellaceae bacterium]|jgi:hypothetical protein|nr:hypothetical protein [Prevotellaceae bacterium]